ncbi:MAG: radical SAM protein, partial [Candidatus Krumholzibacteria bacterium]|nr:radical SAM protein [Candidatus Krumholzibacteria bacterium]
SASEVLKDYDKYPVEAFAHVFATRGCPYNCFFCGSREIWSRKVRFRSVENVIREIKLLQEKGIGFIRFEDDIFGINKRYLNKLCDALLRHCPGLRWSCEIHVKLVDEQNISSMKRAGCSAIYIGIESGNNEMLKQIRKNYTIERALSACEIIKRHGIELHAFFMAGLPQETEETLNDTLMAIKKIKCDRLIYSIFTPYPGTEAFAFCKANGLIDDDYDVSLYHHQSPANCFCINITPERFRVIVSRLEKIVDRKNSLSLFKLLFAPSTYWRIKQLGIYRSFRKGMGMFIGK